MDVTSNKQSVKSSHKRTTPLGQNLEDAIKAAKDEMKDYIDELLKKSDDANKKKMLDLEASIKRGGMSGNTSPTGTGRGLGR